MICDTLIKCYSVHIFSRYFNALAKTQIHFFCCTINIQHTDSNCIWLDSATVQLTIFCPLPSIFQGKNVEQKGASRGHPYSGFLLVLSNFTMCMLAFNSCFIGNLLSHQWHVIVCLGSVINDTSAWSKKDVVALGKFAFISEKFVKSYTCIELRALK